MKRYLIALLLCLTIPALAAEPPASGYPVTECQSPAEVQQARAQGAVLIKTGGRYFVRIGADYKGPYASLETAVKLRKDYEAKAKASGMILPTTGAGEDASMSGAYFNPELMLFPFVDFKPKEGMYFTAPENTVVKTSQVMIHPEPFLFDSVSFGRIVLPVPGSRPAGAPVSPTQALDPRVRMQGKPYFAVAGNVAAKASVAWPSGVEMWVGAAVIDNNGDTLWRQYGPVDAQRVFKCIAPMPTAPGPAAFLTLFTCAKGSIPQTMRPSASFPSIDSATYEYHILCSAGLEMGADWFPPIDQATQEEFNSMQQEQMKQRQERLKEIESRK
ncbi:MAG: hypothetical protein GC154_13770 [bacterium]|nr:hypothetical protein [bacterium]